MAKPTPTVAYTNVITAWICAIQNGFPCHGEGSVSELAAMNGMDQEKDYNDAEALLKQHCEPSRRM